MKRKVKSLSDLAGKDLTDKSGAKVVVVAEPKKAPARPTVSPETRQLRAIEDLGRSIKDSMERFAAKLSFPAPVVNVPDSKPILTEIRNAVEVLAARPVHKKWKFRIVRDNQGDIESVDAEAVG